LQSAETLSVKVADMLDGDSEMPGVLSRFPETGKKINEEIYINESVLGHKFLGKAFKANYELGSDAFSIFIIENNSTDETWKYAQSYLSSVGQDALESGNGKYVLTDGYNGTIFLSWNDKIMVIISGLSKDQTELADRYTSEILK